MTTITKDQAVQLARDAFERHWLNKRGPKKALRELLRREDQPQVYVNDSPNRHWVTWQAAYKLARNQALDDVSGAWSEAMQSDLENGVKFLNEVAADNLRKSYPEIYKFGAAIESLKDNTL